MKKILSKSIIALLSIILLAACQSSKGVDPEDIIKEAYDKRDDVGSYYINSDMAVDIKAESMEQSQTAIFKGVIDEKNNEANVETIEESGDQKVEGGAIFIDGNVQYGLENGQWQKYDLDYGDIREAGTTYYEIMAAVKDFDEYAEKTKEDGSYKATYEGPATDVFSVFEEVFTLTLDGFDYEDETVMTIEATFDEETYFLTELLINIAAEADVGKVNMDINTTIKDFQEATVELPDEIDEIE